MSLENFLKDSATYFSRVTNRNEKAVQKVLLEMIQVDNSKLAVFDEKDVQDVYAISLNNLPTSYAHKGTIVVNKQVVKEDIVAVIENAIEIVRNNPKV